MVKAEILLYEVARTLRLRGRHHIIYDQPTDPLRVYHGQPLRCQVTTPDGACLHIYTGIWGHYFQAFRDADGSPCLFDPVDGKVDVSDGKYFHQDSTAYLNHNIQQLERMSFS